MKRSKPYLVGIAGPTCSGKSLIADRLSQRLNEKQPVIISCDSYYRDLSALSSSERSSTNFDHPDAIEWELLEDHLKILCGGGEILQPQYDFSSHTRSDHSIRLKAGELIILEGLFVLHRPEIRRMPDIKVFVMLPESHSITRRLERDVRDRGRTPESIMNQYNSTVKVMMEKFVLPSGVFADIVIDGMDPVENSVARVMSGIKLPR